MIIEMSKITLLMMKNKAQDALDNLSQLGLVHVEHVNNPVSEDISYIEEELLGVEKAMSVLSADTCQCAIPTGDEISFTLKEVLNLSQEQDDLIRHSEELTNQSRWYELWGAVSLKSLETLKESGYHVSLYSAPLSYKEEMQDDEELMLLKETKEGLQLVLVTKDAEKRLDLKEETLPLVEVSEIKAQLRNNNKSLDSIDESLSKLSKYRELIFQYQKELESKLELANVRHGMGQEESLLYVQGFVPSRNLDKLYALADKEGLGIVSSEPEEMDEPPTLIENKKAVGIIAPLFKFMGTVPGYREFDISFWFLLFFTLFFAMLIGDAGYGIVFLALTAFARKKAKDAPIEPFALVAVLSVATIFWGTITGTWFGSQAIASFPLLSKLAFFKEKAGDQNFMMSFCFLIGAIHMTIAHLIVAYKCGVSKKAVAQIGWAFVIWGLYFVAGVFVLGNPFPMVGKVAMILGSVLIAAGSTGAELGNLPLDIISGFSDVVSYLRLFAVGYASVIVAQSFNTMAVGNGVNSILSGIIAAFILFAGHSLNIALGLMAIIVHGVRLNMLEFSGHLGMEWSGKEYKPFKK